MLLIFEQSQSLVNVEERIGGMVFVCTTSGVNHSDIAGTVSQCRQSDFSLHFSQLSALDFLRIVSLIYH